MSHTRFLKNKVHSWEGKMEEINQKMDNMQLKENQKKNKIQVSNTKNPLFFYVNLAKRYLKHYDEVELSALGKGTSTVTSIEKKVEAIATVVTVAEILKNNGLAVVKRILTSTVDIKDETRSRPLQKAKVEIILGKSHDFEELMDASEEKVLVDEHDNNRQ